MMAIKYRKPKDLIHPFDEDQWDTFELYRDFLKPYKTITTMLSGAKYSTLGSVVPFFNLLFDELDKAIETYKERIGTKLNPNRNKTLHAAAEAAQVCWFSFLTH